METCLQCVTADNHIQHLLSCPWNSSWEWWFSQGNKGKIFWRRVGLLLVLLFLCGWIVWYEYDDVPQDEGNPYGVPISMGIFKVLDSPLEITTSTIIKRIVSNHEAYLVITTIPRCLSPMWNHLHLLNGKISKWICKYHFQCSNAIRKRQRARRGTMRVKRMFRVIDWLISIHPHHTADLP